ncbi:MAG: tripartite tricarboxylate transporter TctB family protein [Nitrospinota bacterium]|nr:tripartite tricarboxylate transporter TctB family protein [Nitrospinota bacterium]
MNRKDFIVGVLFFIFSLIYFFYFIPTQIISSFSESEFAGRIFRPETFPQLTISIFGFVSLLLVGDTLVNRVEIDTTSSTSGRPFYQAIIVFLAATVYVYLLEWLGFHLISPFLLAFLMIFYGTRNWRIVVPVSLLVPISIERFFWLSFKVMLPEGELVSQLVSYIRG